MVGFSAAVRQVMRSDFCADLGVSARFRSMGLGGIVELAKVAFDIGIACGLGHKII